MSNFNRTQEYLANFSREKVLKNLVNNDAPLIIDIGANMGQSIKEFFDYWPNSNVVAFEQNIIISWFIFFESEEHPLNISKNKS